MKRSESSSTADSRTDRIGSDRPITLALIVDNRLLRDGLAAVIQLRSDFSVLASSANEALLLAPDVVPDVVLIDYGLARGNSVAVAAAIRGSFPTSKIIVIGALSIPHEIIGFVRLGASGFVMKDASFDELTNTIAQVVAGAQVLPRELTKSLFDHIGQSEISTPRLRWRDSVRLTGREREVIDAIGKGLSNKEIAMLLHIAVHTVKSHVHSVLKKLSLNSRLEVAAFSHASTIDRVDDG